MTRSRSGEETEDRTGPLEAIRARIRDTATELSRKVSRAFAHAGAERETALLILKSVIAATVAWYLADSVFQAQMPTFAPFSALLMVQATIIQSLDQWVRYCGAMLFGVGLVGATVLPWGTTLWLFAALLLVAVSVGRWYRLGNQGAQVAVAAVFAFGSFATSDGENTGVAQLGELVGLVLLGSAVGVVISLAVAPPLRYRSAAYAVDNLAQSLSQLLSDIGSGVSEGLPEEDTAEDWRRRADQMPRLVGQTRYTIEHAAETLRFNPRRLMMRGSSTFSGYRAIINALDRISAQAVAITKGLHYATQREDGSGPAHEQFLDDFGELLNATADVSVQLGQLHTVQDLAQDQHLPDTVESCRNLYQRLVEHSEGVQLDQPTQWAIYGGLHIDADRLVEECTNTLDELARYAHSPAGRRQRRAHGDEESRDE